MVFTMGVACTRCLERVDSTDDARRTPRGARSPSSKRTERKLNSGSMSIGSAIDRITLATRT
jgi:hypothetical protein